ncbi:Iron-sulfur cluster biosynthesis [compost metagenome]
MINVTKDAAAWFKDELDVQEGQAIRFFARYSAGGTIHPGFSLGIGIESPVSPGAKSEVEGITFYMEDKDLWYLQGYKLNVIYNRNQQDIEYEYEKTEAAGVQG